MKKMIILTALAIMSVSYTIETNIEEIKKQTIDLSKELKNLTHKAIEISKRLNIYHIAILHDNPQNAFDISCRSKIWQAIDKKGKNLESSVSACLNNPEFVPEYLDNEQEEIKKLVREYYTIDKDIIAKYTELDRLNVLIYFL